MADLDSTQTKISFRTAVAYWLKLGLMSFGGPAGQIAMMHQELVDKRHWISEKRFLNALNYTLLLPGPEAQQLATYMGWLMHGLWGGLIAGVLFVLPAFVILVALSWGYMAYGDVSWVAAVFDGIQPAVLAIVLVAVYRLASRVLHHRLLWSIALASFIGIAVFQLPFPLIILLALMTGLLLSRVAPKILQTPLSSQSYETASNEALIGDETHLPHTQFHWRRFVMICLVALIVWLGGLAGLVLLSGQSDIWQAFWVQLAWFFTKAAWLTFGGAYAVLPYVYQGAVEHYGWLTAPQMMDGLALGETTPGPLIMVVTFIGFVAGWGQMAWTDMSPFMNGLVAAAIVTCFSFLPSFLLILAGAPLMESGRENVRLKGLLTAVSAALVGVMLNLAVFFGYHVLWSQLPTLSSGFAGWLGVEWFALGIVLLALWLMLTRHWGFISVIALSALLGVVQMILTQLQVA